MSNRPIKRRPTKDPHAKLKGWVFSDCPYCAYHQLEAISKLTGLFKVAPSPCQCCNFSAIWNMPDGWAVSLNWQPTGKSDGSFHFTMMPDWNTTDEPDDDDDPRAKLMLQAVQVVEDVAAAVLKQHPGPAAAFSPIVLH
jgi:hypothetical protein